MNRHIIIIRERHYQPCIIMSCSIVFGERLSNIMFYRILPVLWFLALS